MMVLIFIDLAMRISLDQRKRALEIYMRSDLSFTLFITNWQSLFGNEPYPNRKFMSRLVKKFRETGSVGDRKRNRTCTVRSESNVVSVGAYFQNNKGTSLRGFIKETHIDISISSLRNILKKDLKFKCYKSRRFHHLNGVDDYEARYNMCLAFREAQRNDPTFLSRIVWTDECYMKLNGVMNTSNICWWASENPHIIAEKSQNSCAVMVFVGFTRYGPIGPWFFDDLQFNNSRHTKNKNSVSGESFKELLETKIIPELRAIFPEDIFNELLFQLDGARGHTAAKVKSCLNAIFPDRWIGNGGPMHWAPRSPDLTPLGMLLSRLISLHLLFFLRFFLLGLP